MDVAFEFTPLVASKLIVYTFGSLVHLFLMVLILGNRRLQRLEALLFALMAALFMWNSGNLLAINVGLFYGVGPEFLTGFARLIAFLGLMASAPLLVHVNVEYLARLHRSSLGLRVLSAAFYLPVVAAPFLVGYLLGHHGLEPLVALGRARLPMLGWVVSALGVSAVLNAIVAERSWLDDPRLKRFHGWVAGLQGALALGLAWVYLLRPMPVPGLGGYFPTSLMLLAVVPSGLLGYSIFRYNFLDLRVQRNVIYSVAVVFGFLLYLNFMRRLSGWLEARDILPAAVTEGVLIFMLVVLLEPVKRLIDRALHKAFVSEFGRVQRLAADIQDFAKLSGDVEAVRRFVEDRVRSELGLEQIHLTLGHAGVGAENSPTSKKTRVFPVRRAHEVVAVLEVTPRTSNLSGEQFGALQVLADQLAAALELCQLIADKVNLERELAEKAKMAFLGEMAARIAHNVKNPLSSMKTLVQLLEADATVPERARQDLRMVVEEIDRLNVNISQVLRYAKPARDTDRPVDLALIVNRVLALTRAEAEMRQVRLEFEPENSLCPVEGGEEAVSDIVSNLVVNALQASAPGRTVRVRIGRCSEGAQAELWVEDQGPGIPPELKERIFQPFFTTRAGGTGLGLAIVARRAEEIHGSVDCQSPVARNEGGSRFHVRFRAAA